MESQAGPSSRRCVYFVRPSESSGSGKFHTGNLEGLEVTIYIEEESDSMVLFPLESGKFKSNQVVIGSTYEVHGEPISGSPDATSSATPQRISTPYGVYTSLTFQSVMNPLPPLPPRSSET